MCGIFGIASASSNQPLGAALLQGLRCLEYRGYDSAGVALIDESQMRVYREVGPVDALAAVLPDGITGVTGLAHTRWATHGGVTRENAHPHVDPSGRVVVIHNGVIDDADGLRTQLLAAGEVLSSETDSEVLACRIAAGLEAHGPVGAVRRALRGLSGTWGLVVGFVGHPGLLVAARMGSPLCVGLGDGGAVVASDPSALVAHCQRVFFLDDGDIAVLNGARVHTERQEPIQKGARPAHMTPVTHHLDPSLYLPTDRTAASWMAQEITEQPAAMRRCLAGRLDPAQGSARLGGLSLTPQQLVRLKHAVLLGCGTSLHAAELGAQMLRHLARLPAQALLASEVEAGHHLVDADALHLALSQSGETWDTLAAVAEVHRRGGSVHGIVNAVGSTLARTCGAGVYLHAGPEIAVASTKAFTSQVTALALIALHIGRTRHLGPPEAAAFAQALATAPDRVAQTITQMQHSPALSHGLSHGLAHSLSHGLAEATERICHAPVTILLGRGPSWPVAREGALKLEELSWRPTRACAAGELKHGPLALVTEGTPVIVIAPDDHTRAATMTTIHEVRARGAVVIVIHSDTDQELAGMAHISLPTPLPDHPLLSPLCTVLPLQQLAHDVALALGRDVDRPRNLAKSVTVA